LPKRKSVPSSSRPPRPYETRVQSRAWPTSCDRRGRPER
jgi:hypothetical protein